MQQFTTVDVNGSMMTTMIARYAIAEAARTALNLKEAAWYLHPMQEAIIVDLGFPPMSFCGFPMIVSDTMPEDEIELRSSSGDIIARIKNLGMLDGNVPRGT